MTERGSLWLGGFALLGAVGWLLVQCLDATGGELTYILDDAYIHLTLARNLALDGELAITPGSFAFATSSPLWTVLLALIFLALGPTIWVPFTLNLLIALLCVWVVDRFARQSLGLNQRTGALLVVAFVFVAPVPLLVFTGMEHLLQLLLAIVFVTHALQLIEEGEYTAGEIALTGFLGGLLVATRYEGLFLVGPAVGYFLLRREFASGAGIAALSVTPVTLAGAYSVSQGGTFLPSSVLLKGGVTQAGVVHDLVRFFGGEWIGDMVSLAPDLHVLALGCALAVVLGVSSTPGELSRREVTWPTTVVAAVVLHMTFAEAVWFYRYDAYLVGLGILALALPLTGSTSSWLQERFDRLKRPAPRLATIGAVCLLAVVALSPLVTRFTGAMSDVPRAARDIHRQQRYMALFLDSHYRGASVALNDIGMPGYAAEIAILDLFGLGTPEVARLRLAGRYDTDTIRRLAQERETEIAMVYDAWYGERLPELPDEWVKVEEWTVEEATVLGDETVSIYAVAPGSRDDLERHLESFADRLPAGVRRRSVNAPPAPTP